MTTEPKFIPNEAVKISINDNIDLKVRLIDCVGYMVDGATGYMEENGERMVKTPWFDYEIPFTKAASIGTNKVIKDHSTIGIVVTTDGSFGDIERSSYIEAEKQTIVEMKQLNKPYIVILNTNSPNSKETKELDRELTNEYNSPVMPVNCDQLKAADITSILEALLLEFPIAKVNFNIPKWLIALDNLNPVKEQIINTVKDIMKNINIIRDVYREYPVNSYIDKIKLDSINMDVGKVNINIDVPDSFYYNMLSELIGEDIDNEYQFINVLKNMSDKKKEYEQVAEAMSAVKIKGYGSVTPTASDIKLEKPEIIMKIRVKKKITYGR